MEKERLEHGFSPWHSGPFGPDNSLLLGWWLQHLYGRCHLTLSSISPNLGKKTVCSNYIIPMECQRWQEASQCFESSGEVQGSKMWLSVLGFNSNFVV